MVNRKHWSPLIRRLHFPKKNYHIDACVIVVHGLMVPGEGMIHEDL